MQVQKSDIHLPYGCQVCHGSGDSQACGRPHVSRGELRHADGCTLPVRSSLGHEDTATVERNGQRDGCAQVFTDVVTYTIVVVVVVVAVVLVVVVVEVVVVVVVVISRSAVVLMVVV